MRTYYIFNVNKYFTYMYKKNPFKMYKIFVEIYNTKDYDSIKTYRIFEQVATPFNKILLNEYIYFDYKYKYGYKKIDNTHYLRTSENSILTINNYNIKLRTESNYSDFFTYLNKYNINLFVCDFENKDYFWLDKLVGNSLQKKEFIVK